MELKRLLVIDDDFNEYDTPKALERAIERLKGERIDWQYDLSKQGEAYYIENVRDNYQAILIDNDFDEGIKALWYQSKTKLPIGYVSAYSAETLALKMQEKGIGNGSHKGIEKGLKTTFIQKAGKNISKNVSAESLENKLYDFLLASSQ